jgi:ribosomal protein S18 acetylase RimI-like enzyme
MRSRPLKSISGRELRPLLEEEIAHWKRELAWDFSEVASAVEGGLDRGGLAGRFLEDETRPLAYCYSMVDGTRSIVGSVFATESLRGQGIEETLLDSVLADTRADSRTSRVECQTLFCTAIEAERHFSRAGFVGRPRHYLMRELAESVRVPAHDFTVRSLRRRDLDAAADVIYESHRGSLDAALNTTYSSSAACRGFVETLVLRSGCGRHTPEASLVAETGPDAPGGRRLLGVILGSALSATNGHVCQVSVVPDMQGRGLGRVLVLSALSAFRDLGLRVASLSVTVGNTLAYGLYEQLGFRLRREFAAYAWVRPPGRIELPAEQPAPAGARE